MKEAVELQAVSKQYGKKQVLDKIDLAIQEGTIYGLIGPSGSGKTTLIKMIIGLILADSGSIRVLDADMPNLEMLERIGYMAQSDALYLELTGRENLAFFASLYPMNKAESRKQQAYVAEVVNLSGELDKKVEAYSGGMKRRLSLAIALVHNPALLILDEPTVGMDPELRLTVWNEFFELKREFHKTIVITTHVMDEAERCDVVSLVRGGRILATGSPAELKAAYGAEDLEEVFLKAGRKHP
jgi:ABC-2 type transport system ATP-binding protein